MSALRPAEALAALERALRSKEPPRVVVLTQAPAARTEEPFLCEIALRRILDDAARREAEVTSLESSDAGLYAALTTRSLFGRASVRVVRAADALLKGGAADDDAEDAAPSTRSREAAIRPFERAALAFARNGSEGDLLVFEARKLRAPFARALREAGALVVEFRALYDKPFRGDGPVESTELGEFARMLADERGLRLSRGTLGAILARTGSSLGAVAAALDKLRAVGGERELTPADAQSHVPLSRPGSPWTLAEAILCGDAARALSEIAAVAAAGARDGDGRTIAADGAYAMALTSLVRDGRRSFAAAEQVARGASLESAAASVGVPAFPAALESFRRRVQARSRDEHRRFLDELSATEGAIRIRGEKARSALERLAVRTRR